MIIEVRQNKEVCICAHPCPSGSLHAFLPPCGLDWIGLAVRREFEVCSRAFPGRKHRWRLSRAVQSGRVGTRGLLLRDVALALRLLVVTGRNRIDSHFLSLKASALALSRATFLLLGEEDAPLSFSSLPPLFT